MTIQAKGKTPSLALVKSLKTATIKIRYGKEKGGYTNDCI
jgi:hypothetical protein